jgi:CO dehydrogenase maturation factor
MRIGFLGKGGSGKTTITAAFTRWLEGMGTRVIAIDGDVNTHLQEALDIEPAPPQLGRLYDEIAGYVRGERKDLGERPLLSTTPPSPDSRFITCDEEDPFLARYATTRGSLSFLRVGGFQEHDVGANCYHTKLHSMCVVLNHLKDTENDWVVVDATAGVDTLSTSLVAAYDLNVFVIEPTTKSINVYKDYLATDAESATRTVVLINKVVSESDLDFVRKALPDACIVGSVSHSGHLRHSEQGDPAAFRAFVDEHDNVWRTLKSECSRRRRSWGAFQTRLHEIHQKNCEWWYNAYYNQTLHTGLDGPFESDGKPT